MDVFTHALESYVSTAHNEFSSALAEKAIEICGVFLLRAYLDGSDMHARKKMHVASCLAGLSFNTAGLGITHSMAHQLGAMFHIPHGRANAMLLPHIVEFNANINKHSRSQKEYLPAVKRYANIAHILGLSNYNKVMSVRSLVNWIQFMLKEMNIPLTIQEIGTITPDAYFAAIDKMAEAALADACTPTNPRVPTKEDIIKPENLVAKKPTLMNDNPMHYCPGCSHGVVHKLVAEVIEEMGLEDKAIGISPVGCAVFIYNYIDIDWQEAAHGRAPALATAIKRLWPDRLVFTYQGDGDLACIGTAETIHALNRGENITIIFINNAIYGMTGGQMAPTTLVGMKTSTSPYGRDVHLHGYPLKMADIAAQLEGTAYVTRQSVQSVPAIRKAKKAIRKAFENSMAGKGSNLVEIVSTCNSGWKMSPAKSNEWMVENMFPFYPLGDLKDK